MKLTDAKVRNAKFEGKIDKLRDGNGLYLHIMPSGKYWRYDYRYQGKRKTLALGVFPAVSLKAARIALFEAKGRLDQGIDPSYEKQLSRFVGVDHSFESVAKEWIEQHDCSDRTKKEIRQKFGKDVYPVIGEMNVKLINPPDVLAVLRRIESRDALDLARRVCTNISQVMRYAVYTGLIDSDPCRDLRGAIRKKRKTKRYPAITDRKQFGELLRAIDTYSLNVVIGYAIQIAPYVALRPSELRQGKWSEIDTDAALWEIPASRMKKDRDHLVPLSRQVIALIERLRKITGSDKHGLMFPSPVKEGQPISENTMNKALERVGYPGSVHTPHGFRSTFSTMVNQSYLFSPDAVEAQLAHLDPDRVRAAYNRAAHIEQRTEIMQWWGDQIDAMRQSVHDDEGIAG